MQRILVIEDDTDINRLLCRILAKAGYETTAAYSGTEAQLRLERETPDMIMLDLMLPGISGEEIIKMARTEMGLQIPILVLSARTALKNKVETITLGADDYITKPFEPEELLACVRSLLRRGGGDADRRRHHLRDRAAGAGDLSAVLRGAGEMIIPMVSSFVSLWLARIPVAYILAATLGRDSIYFSYAAGWLLGVISPLSATSDGKWKNKMLLIVRPQNDGKSS